jgi:hypothetical protein
MYKEEQKKNMEKEIDPIFQSLADFVCSIFDYINSTHHQVESWNHIFKFIVLGFIKIRMTLFLLQGTVLIIKTLF